MEFWLFAHVRLSDHNRQYLKKKKRNYTSRPLRRTGKLIK